MKHFILSIVLFCVFAGGDARADISISYVVSQVSGEMYVSGYTDNYKSVTGPNTSGPPYSASVSGMSGVVGGNIGTYSASISNNIPSNGTTITATGAFSASYNVPTATLLAGQAYAYQEIDFTVASNQIFSISGNLAQGTAFLYNSSLATPFIFSFSAGSSTPLAYSTTLAPGGTYEFVITSGISFAPPATPPGSSASSSGGFDITINTQSAVPEPSSLVLATLAGFGVAGGVWRRTLRKNRCRPFWIPRSNDHANDSAFFSTLLSSPPVMIAAFLFHRENSWATALGSRGPPWPGCTTLGPSSRSLATLA